MTCRLFSFTTGLPDLTANCCDCPPGLVQGGQILAGFLPVAATAPTSLCVCVVACRRRPPQSPGWCCYWGGVWPHIKAKEKACVPDVSPVVVTPLVNPTSREDSLLPALQYNNMAAVS